MTEGEFKSFVEKYSKRIGELRAMKSGLRRA